MAEPNDAESGALLRIGAVAKRTGVSEHTLRMWERRYGSLARTRAKGGGRLYGEREVQRILLLRDLVALGHSIGQIATLSDDELKRALLAAPGSGAADAVGARPAGEGPGAAAFRGARAGELFMEAVLRLDTEEASRVLSEAALNHPTRALVEECIGPALRRIGELWHEGKLSVAHEHAASAVVRSLLGTMLRAQRVPPGAPTIVCATPAGERHELGAMMSAVLLAEMGWRVVYLGAELPASDLAKAASDVGARAIALSLVQYSPRAEATIRELVTLTQREVLLGGPGAASLRVPGVTAVSDVLAWRPRAPG